MQDKDQQDKIVLSLRNLTDNSVPEGHDVGQFGFNKYDWSKFIEMLPTSVKYYEMLVSKATFISFLKGCIFNQTGKQATPRNLDDLGKQIENGSIMLMDAHSKIGDDKQYYIFSILSDNSKPINSRVVLTISPGFLSENAIFPSNITREL